MMNTYTTFASWDAVKQYAYEHTITYYGKNKTNEDDYYYINSEILRTLRIVPSKLGMPHTADDSFIEQHYREAPSDAANLYGVNVRKQVANGIWDAYRFLNEMRKSFKRSDWMVVVSPQVEALVCTGIFSRSTSMRLSLARMSMAHGRHTSPSIAWMESESVGTTS